MASPPMGPFSQLERTLVRHMHGNVRDDFWEPSELLSQGGLCCVEVEV